MVFFNPYRVRGVDGAYCIIPYNDITLVLYQKGRNHMDLTELLGSIEDSTPPQVQKAVLWGPESLLKDSVEFFLKAGAGWEVVKISCESGTDYLLQRVETVKPTVVILCQERDAADATLLMQLAQIQACMKVVAVSMESNLMQVYSRSHLIMHDVADFISY
jgi:hypothetical protein